MKVARITNKHKLLLGGEIKLFPKDLLGGRNWFNLEEAKKLQEGKGGYSDGEKGLVLTNTYAYGTGINMGDILEPDKEYTISFKQRLLSGEYHNTIAGSIRLLLGGDTYRFGNQNEADVSVAFISPPNPEEYRMYLYGSNSGTVEFYDIKIELGDETAYTLSPEDLGLVYSDDVESFYNRVDRLGNLWTTEIVEYPLELEGTRNLSQVKYGWDTYGGSLTSTTIVKASDKVKGTLVEIKGGETYAYQQEGTGNIFRYFWFKNNPLEDPSEISLGGGYTVIPKTVTAHQDANFGFFLHTRDVETNPVDNIKLELGEESNKWTPSPESLGLEYADNVHKFGLRIEKDRVIAQELIEGVEL